MTISLDRVTPLINQRVAIDQDFVIVYDGNFDQSTVTLQNISFEKLTYPNLTDQTEELYVGVSFSVVSNPATTVTITPDEDLVYNTFYQIVFTSGVEDFEGNVISKVFKFITITQDQSEISTLNSNGYPNDVVYKGDKLQDIHNIRTILTDGSSEFNYNYNPTTYDPITKTYATDTSELIVVDNHTIIKEKFKEQFLVLYTDYLSNIKNSSYVSDADYLKIEQTLFPLSFDLSTSSGLIDKIDFLFRTYANAMNRFFLQIEPDPNETFVYHISTNLSKLEWSKILKELLHPIGWQEIYVGIDDKYLEGDNIGAFSVDVSTNKILFEDHNLLDGMRIHFSSTVNLPIGIDELTEYYVINATTDNFQISSTEGGTSIDILTEGNGIHFVYTLWYLQTDQYNWSNEYLHDYETTLTSGVGSVKSTGIYFFTHVDLSAYTGGTYENGVFVDGVAQNNILDGGELVGKILYLTSGTNQGKYTIVGHTAKVNNNYIRVNEYFEVREGSVEFEIQNKLDDFRSTYGIKIDKDDVGHSYNRSITIPKVTTTGSVGSEVYSHRIVENWVEETSDKSLLNVLNSLKYKNKYPFSYLDARQLSSQTGARSMKDGISRLTFDEFGCLQLILYPNSEVKEWTANDVTFQYDSDASPELYVTSENFVQDEFSFGNVQLINGFDSQTNYTVNEQINPHGYSPIEIVNFAAPVDGVQLLTIDVTGYDPPVTTLNESDTLTITGASNLNNNGIFIISKQDVVNNKVYVVNDMGVSENCVDDMVYATHIIPSHHHISTFILPSTFSFDFNLWSGFNIYFYFGKIDPEDYNDNETFAYQYAEYDAWVSFPITGDSGYVAWINSMEAGEADDDTVTSSVGGDIYEKINKESYFLKQRFENTFKQYSYSSTYFANSLEVGKRIYEYDIDGEFLSDIVSKDGVLIGTVEYFTSTVPDAGIGFGDLVVQFLNNKISHVTTVIGGSWENVTSASNNDISDDVELMGATATVGDYVYFGADKTFDILTIKMSTAGAGVWTITWDYWDSNITSWEPLTSGDFSSVTESNHFRVAGINDYSFTKPADWGTTEVNGSGMMYFIRAKVSGTPTISQNPIAQQIHINSETTSFEDDKYYSMKEKMGYTLDGFSIKGDALTDSSISFDRKYILGYGISDFDDFEWNITSVGPTETSVSTVFYNTLHLLCKADEVYNVTIDVGWSAPIVLTSTGGLTFHEDGGAGKSTLVRSSGSWITDGVLSGSSLSINGTMDNNGSYIIETITASTLTLDSVYFIDDNISELPLNSQLEGIYITGATSENETLEPNNFEEL